MGDIGPGAYDWIEWMADAGITWWQVLPINPPGFTASPYQALSAFAGNPLLISPDLLLGDGLIEEIPPAAQPSTAVDFEYAERWKLPVLAEAADRLIHSDRLDEFKHEQAHWLDDYTLFASLKEAHGGGALFEWPAGLRSRSAPALDEARERLAGEIERQAALQFLFFDQWNRLHTYAASRGIRLMGDVPIFVAADSADFWTRPELFDLDGAGNPRVVAGVPPDYFADTGQLWGNPQYDWEAHADEGYAWWIARLRTLLQLVESVRIDHFRAFADYWEIPAGSPTAEHGQWVLGPGSSFFDAVREELGSLPFIAEDLGELHRIVPELRDAVGLPGMKIGQLSFRTPPDPPSTWAAHTIGYTGTHDNDTTAGWWVTASEIEKERAGLLEGIRRESVADDLLRAVWESASVVAVAPIQDVLGLGPEARMNVPGTVGAHNWTWRLEALPAPERATILRELNDACGR